MWKSWVEVRKGEESENEEGKEGNDFTPNGCFVCFASHVLQVERNRINREVKKIWEVCERGREHHKHGIRGTFVARTLLTRGGETAVQQEVIWLCTLSAQLG